MQKNCRMSTSNTQSMTDKIMKSWLALRGIEKIASKNCKKKMVWDTQEGRLTWIHLAVKKEIRVKEISGNGWCKSAILPPHWPHARQATCLTGQL